MDEIENVSKSKKSRKRFTVNQALEIAMLLYMTMLYAKMNEIQEVITTLLN